MSTLRNLHLARLASALLVLTGGTWLADAKAQSFATAIEPGIAAAPGFAPEPVYVQPGHSGSWTDTERRGQGFDLQITGPHSAVASWQTAAPKGGPLWLYGEGQVHSDRIDFLMYQVEGGKFPGTEEEGGSAQVKPWGRLIFTIAHCQSATLSWTPEVAGFPAGSTRLSRLTMPAGLSCSTQHGIFQDTDLGAPVVKASSESEGQRGVVLGAEVLVATGDGLWRRRIDGNSPWVRSGLEGLDVSFVSLDSSSRGRLFAGGQPADSRTAAFHVSYDGGRSWEAALSGPIDPDGRPEGFVDVVVAPPNNPDQLFASLAGGPGVAFSTDGGRNWERVNGGRESLFGYSCHLGVRPDAPDRLYQGCEAPLDSASLWAYDLTARALGVIGEPRVLVGLDRIQNRRPQQLLHSPARPGWMYAGLEGALVAFDDRGALEYVYRAEDGGRLPYIYVAAVWIDPSNPRHLVFGGGLNGPDGQLTIFETFDHGLTLQPLSVPSGLRNPEAQTLIALDAKGDEFIVIAEEMDADFGNSRTRVVRLERTLVPTAGAMGAPRRIRVGTGSVN